MPSIKHLSLPVPSDLLPCRLPSRHPPFLSPSPSVRLPQPGCRVICTQNAKMNVATVVVNNTGASHAALDRANPTLSRWPYRLLKCCTHRGLGQTHKDRGRLSRNYHNISNRVLAARSDQAWLPSKSKGWCQSRQKNHACMPPNNKNIDNRRIAGTLRPSLSHFSFHAVFTVFSALAFQTSTHRPGLDPFSHSRSTRTATTLARR